MTSRHDIADMKNITDPRAQIVALKRLKNEAIGHVQKREALVKAGLLASLAELLNACHKSRTHFKSQEIPTQLQDPATDADEASYQALTILVSIAQADASFIAPISAAGIPSLLVTSLSSSGPSAKVTSAILKVLLALVSADHDSSLDGTKHASLIELCLSNTAIKAYIEILSDRSQSHLVKQQVCLVCQLLEKTISTDAQRATLHSNGLVDRLAAQLTSYYVHNHPRSSQIFAVVVGPLPTPPSVRSLGHILGAVDAIVAGSKHRVATLLYSPVLYSVLPSVPSQIRIVPKIHQSSQQSVYDVNPRDLALPAIHARIEKADGTNFLHAFPALGAFRGPNDNSRSSAFVDFADVAPTPDNKSSPPILGSDSAFIPWLISLMRTTKGFCRVKAAALLVSIVKVGLVGGSKDRTLALLVVPLLAEILKQAQYSHGSLKGAASQNPFQNADLWALSEAPGVLASLLEEVPSLQKAAVEAGALKDVCQLLKHTFGPVEAYPPLWSAQSDSIKMEEELPTSSMLGDPGVAPNITWLFRTRANALLLVAALAYKEDVYRKQLCDLGMIACVMDSLSPFDESSLSQLQAQESGTRKDRLDSSLGNPEMILLAACKAARSLSRSVALLRTSLVDAALAKPIYALVEHQSVKVKVAALTVLCNLIMNFSPMRADIVDAGAIETLCEHARSADTEIRSASLWALKLLVSQAPHEVKMSCIDGLGTGWLDQTISGSSVAKSASKAQPFSSISSTNSRGERVELLQPSDDHSMQDTGNVPSFGSNFITEQSSYSLDENSGPRSAARTPLTQQSHALYLEGVKRAEDAQTAMQPGRDALQIQRHALDVLRNATAPPTQIETIEHLSRQFGLQRLCDIVASKLRPMANAATAPTLAHVPGDLGGVELASRYQPAPMLESALWLFVHLAGSAPRIRQMLIAQIPLLTLLHPLFRYPDQNIRRGCIWVVNNLMWVDDASDLPGARSRQQELAKLGFRDSIKALQQDPSLDVAERASTGMALIEGRHQT